MPTSKNPPIQVPHSPPNPVEWLSALLIETVYTVLPHMASSKVSFYCLFQILNSAHFLDKCLTYRKHSKNWIILLLLLSPQLLLLILALMLRSAWDCPTLFSNQQQILIKKKRWGRSDLGLLVSQFGKTLCNPELWWEKQFSALLVLKKLIQCYIAGRTVKP